MEMLDRVKDMIWGRKDSGIFREIPTGLSGKLFTSPMPFGAYDKGNRLIKAYHRHGVSHVFSLVTDAEVEKKARKNIFKEYASAGIGCSRYVIQDFQAPEIKLMQDLVAEGVDRLRKGEKIIIHCHAGVGRTAVAAACIYMKVKNCSADSAIDHVKADMMVNLTAEQKRLIHLFGEHLSVKPWGGNGTQS